MSAAVLAMTSGHSAEGSALTTTMSDSLMLRTKSCCLSGKSFCIVSIAATSEVYIWRTSRTLRGSSVTKCSSFART